MGGRAEARPTNLETLAGRRCRRSRRRCRSRLEASRLERRSRLRGLLLGLDALRLDLGRSLVRSLLRLERRGLGLRLLAHVSLGAGEELGLVGVIAILGLYFVVIQRGLRIGASAADDFRAILATGLALVVGVQAFIIAAGNLKVLPLTGVTLPFVSYGGSSLLANAVVVGLLLALSDRGVEPPPPPSEATGWRRRLRRGTA